MENINFSKNKSLRKNKGITISFILAFAIMLFFFPNEGKFKYDYKIGGHWMYETLEASIDFPILKTEAELMKERAEIADRIIPYYTFDGTVQSKVETELIQAFSAIVDKRTSNFIVSSVSQIYSKGIVSSKDLPSIDGEKLNEQFISVSKNGEIIDMNLGGLYNPHQAALELTDRISLNFNKETCDKVSASINFEQILEPNLIFDLQTTKMIKKKAVSNISNTKGMFYTGQLIVTEGELITDDIKQVLDSYKAEYQSSISTKSDEWSILAGHAVFLALLLCLLYMTLFLIDVNVFNKLNETIFFIFVPVAIFMITVILKAVNQTYLYMVPYAIFAIYMGAFFKNRLVCPAYMISLLPLIPLVDSGTELFCINVISGISGMFLFTFLKNGWKQFLNSLILFVAMFLTYLSFNLVKTGVFFEDINYTIPMFLFLNALFIPATYPLVFLLEKAFGMMSTATLRDLADLNNPVMAELQKKAPGTFQHSLMVSNIAERAARTIDADPRLIKAGAMYHDIGKMANPLCFVENQTAGINYHKDLTPKQSARDILSHITYGVEYARKAHLQAPIIDFIISHHGRSKVLYFYNQHCNNGGNPSEIDEFTYKGMLPKTKEQVILMIADTIEAASRTLKDYSSESIGALIDRLVKQKMDDGQFSEADISLKEINLVCTEMKQHISEIYHSRITYPERKK